MHKKTLRKRWGELVFRLAGKNLSNASLRRSRAFYNLIGRFYDWLYTKPIHEYQNAANHLVEKYIPTGGTVLDLGCGTGVLAKRIAPQADNILGLDLSIRMLQQAKKKLRDQSSALLINADCRYLPFRPGIFDTIVTSFMLVILSSEERIDVIQQVSHLLRDEGRVVFLTSREDLSEQWWSPAMWRQAGNKTGFTQLEIEDCFEYYRIVCMKKT